MKLLTPKERKKRLKRPLKKISNFYLEKSYFNCNYLLGKFGQKYVKMKMCMHLGKGLALIMSMGFTQAATLYWDTNGAGAGFGNAAGTWGADGDAWWTTDSSGNFASGGTATTTSADVLHINQSNLANFSMAVIGNVDALRLVLPGNVTSTINGPGTIRVHTSGEGISNAVISGHNDLKAVVNSNLLLEAAANSTVALGDQGGNNSIVTFNGLITSTNKVDLLYREPGTLGLNATVDIKSGNFRSHSTNQFAQRNQTVGSGVLGSGVHHVYRSGPQGGDSFDKGRLVLGQNQAYTGDTFLEDGIIRLTSNTSLPSTTSVFLTDTTVAGSPLIELNFTGSNNISGLHILGVEQAAGVYNSSTHSSYFTGAGSLTVIPEPGVMSWLALIGLGAIMRRHKKTS